MADDPRAADDRRPRRSWPVPRGRALVVLAAVLLVGTAVSGCQTVGELVALQDVDFRLAGVDRPILAGVHLETVRSYRDLSPRGVLRLAHAVRRREVPLRMELIIAADNPTSNPDARLLQMDWTLLLDGRRTVSGIFGRETLLPSGRATRFPIDVELDLYRFFREDAESLLDVALGAAGRGGTKLQLEARPTVDTPLGPLRYPGTLVLDF